MRKLISTHLFRKQRLHAAHLDTLARAGVEGIELFCARQSFDYRDPAQVASIADWFASNPVALHSLHSPIYADERDGTSGEPPIHIADPDPRIRIAALDEVHRALDIADKMPFRYLVQHLGPGKEEWDQRRTDRALTSLERIHLVAKQAGVAVLVENIPNGLSMPEPLLAFLTQNHLADIGICFDSGHAHLPAQYFGGGGVAQSWDILKGRIKSTHLHDNRGATDDHLWPGQGTLPWADLIPRLKAQGEALPWLLEVRDPGDTPDVATAIRATFDHWENWQSPAAL